MWIPGPGIKCIWGKARNMHFKNTTSINVKCIYDPHLEKYQIGEYFLEIHSIDDLGQII